MLRRPRAIDYCRGVALLRPHATPTLPCRGDAVRRPRGASPPHAVRRPRGASPPKTTRPYIVGAQRCCAPTRRPGNPATPVDGEAIIWPGGNSSAVAQSLFPRNASISARRVRQCDAAPHAASTAKGARETHSLAPSRSRSGQRDFLDALLLDSGRCRQGCCAFYKNIPRFSAFSA